MGWKLLDCAEFPVNCTAKNQEVEADPDVAGIGVVIGFLSTTCLAFLIAFTVIFLDRYEHFINLYRHFISHNKTKYTHDTNTAYWRSPVFWSRVLSKNLLAFSDTQLLTGLAIQFTAMIKHCTLSVYHFRVVVDLAFLTTVTHLLTVIALRNYFVKHKWINLPRIFFMLANLALLGYTSFVAYSYDLVTDVEVDVSMKLACFFQGTRPRFGAAFGGKWALLLVGAIGGHVTVILAMYWLNDPNEGQERKKWWWYVGAGFRTWIVAPTYSIFGIWMAGDGLKHTQALGTPNVDLKGDESEWNFGQFLPVLLLALPIFAGWESFWEEKDEDRENRFGRHAWRRVRQERREMDERRERFEMQAPKRRQQSSGDLSVEERTIESTGPSPAHTPPQQSKSRVSSSMHFSYPNRSTPRLSSDQNIPTGAPLLPPLPLSSTSLGINSSVRTRSPSPSRTRVQTI